MLLYIMNQTQREINMIIRKIISGFTLFLVLSACAGTTKDVNSLLWKVSGNGLSSPSYLFGTHHLVPIIFLDNIKGLEHAFNSTDQVIGELDMSDIMSMQMEIMQKAVMPQEYDYKTMLSDSDYKLLNDKVKEVLGMDFGMIEKMKPAMINNLLMIALYQKYYPDLDTGEGIDKYLQDRALEEGKSVKELESVEDQIFVLLEHQSIDRQAEMLMCGIRYPELLKKQMDKLQDAYLSQDIKALESLYYESMKNDPCPSTDEEKYVMNAGRNKKWLEALPSIMSNKPSFVAVGCLHLVGKEGLIDGLRDVGYRVDPVL